MVCRFLHMELPLSPTPRRSSERTAAYRTYMGGRGIGFKHDDWRVDGAFSLSEPRARGWHAHEYGLARDRRRHSAASTLRTGHDTPSSKHGMVGQHHFGMLRVPLLFQRSFHFW